MWTPVFYFNACNFVCKMFLILNLQAITWVQYPFCSKTGIVYPYKRPAIVHHCKRLSRVDVGFVNQNSGFINQRFDNQGSTTKVRQLKTAVSSTKVRQPKSRIRQPRGSSTNKVGFVNQKRRIHQPRFVNQGSSTKHTDSSTKDSSTKRLDSSTKNGGFINQGSSTKKSDSSTKDSSTKRLDSSPKSMQYIRETQKNNTCTSYCIEDSMRRLVRCTEAVHSVALWTRVTLGLDMCKVCTAAVHFEHELH